MCTCREPTSYLLYPLHLCGHYLAGAEQMVDYLLWAVHPCRDVVPEVLKNLNRVAVTELVHQVHGILHRAWLVAQ